MVISIKCSAKCLAHGKHQIHGPCYCCHSYSVNECGQGPGNILIFLLIEENPVSNQSSRRYSPTRCLFYNVKLMNKRWKRQIYQCNRKFTFAHAHMVLNKQRPKKKKERESIIITLHKKGKPLNLATVFMEGALSAMSEEN